MTEEEKCSMGENGFGLEKIKQRSYRLAVELSILSVVLHAWNNPHRELYSEVGLTTKPDAQGQQPSNEPLKLVMTCAGREQEHL